MKAIRLGTDAHPVHTVHRVGAAILGAFLAIFAGVGFAGGVPLLATDGMAVMGLYTNGLLAGISLIVGMVLIASALRGGPLASMVSVVIGGLFLVSGLGNLVVLGTPMNMLAFQIPNVVFSLAVGVALLTLGAYGRFTGGLPPESPYHRDPELGEPAMTVAQNEEHTRNRTAILDMAEAERAAARRHASPDQLRRLTEAGRHRGHDDRRRAWDTSAPAG